MAKRQSLSRFIGVRFAPAQQAKLLMLAQQAGEPGNMSAALRWLVDKEPAAQPEPPGPGNASAVHALSSQQAGRGCNRGGVTVDELRECPGCDGENIGLDAGTELDPDRMYCIDCGVSGSWENSEAAAVDAWNALPRRSDTDDLRAALERERERSTAYAAELERCGKELERRQHHIRALEAQTQWEPVEDGYTYTDKRDHTLSVYPRCLDIADEASGLSVQLPGDVHLCRRVDAAPDAAEEA